MMSKCDKIPDITIVRSEFRRLVSWNVPMRSLPLWHLYVNDTPGSELVFHERRREIPVNTPLLIPPHTVFATRMDRPMLHFYIDFQIRLPQFDNIPRREIFLPQFPLPQIKQGKLALFALLLNIFAELPASFPAAPAVDRRFEKIIELLESGEYDFAEVCRKAGLSRRTGERLFHRNTGLTPHQYTENLRLDKAHFLLLSSDKEIPEIARLCGYSDRYHFSKSFKRGFGTPPVQYRNQNKA